MKFMAWIEKEQKMVDVSSIEFNGCGFPNAKNSHVLYEIGYRRGKTDYVYEGENNVAIIEYTGLKDNTKWAQLTELERENFIKQGNDPSKWIGREIYGGDVIKSPCDTNQDFHGEYILYEILKINGQWITSYITSENGSKLPRGYSRGFLLDLYEFTPKLFLWSEDYNPSTEIVKIGNIYENPELLK